MEHPGSHFLLKRERSQNAVSLARAGHGLRGSPAPSGRPLATCSAQSNSQMRISMAAEVHSHSPALVLDQSLSRRSLRLTSPLRPFRGGSFDCSSRNPARPRPRLPRRRRRMRSFSLPVPRHHSRSSPAERINAMPSIANHSLVCRRRGHRTHGEPQHGLFPLRTCRRFSLMRMHLCVDGFLPS